MLLYLVTTEINTQAMITICISFEALESTPVKKVCTDRLFHISKLHKLTDLTGTSRCTLTEISQQTGLSTVFPRWLDKCSARPSARSTERERTINIED